MLVKTSELKGLALRYAVILARYPSAFEQKPSIRNICVKYPFDKDWKLTGPLIQQFKVSTMEEVDGNWSASIGGTTGLDKPFWMKSGEDHLIAACRVIVESKLGNTVEVPEELKED